MLIIALVLAVIGLAALVFAVVTSTALAAWVCIGASVLGVLLLVADALRERRQNAQPAEPAEEAESAAEAGEGTVDADEMATDFDAEAPDEFDIDEDIDEDIDQDADEDTADAD